MYNFFKRRRKSTRPLKESSMNFDLENVQPFLERIASLIPKGFGILEIERVVDLANRLEVDDEKELIFQITFDEIPSEFHVRIFMDDVDSPDIYFFSIPALAAKIKKEMEMFCSDTDI